MRLIDISHHNITLDGTLKKYEGVIIRVYYGNKDTQIDKKYSLFFNQLKQLSLEDTKLPYALYFYSYASNKEYARQEAERIEDYIKEAEITIGYLPFCIFGDYEDYALLNKKDTVQEITIERIKTIRDIAIKFNICYGIYCSQEWYKQYYQTNDTIIELDPVLWIVSWSDYEPTVPYDIWKCSSEYNIDGKHTDVSLVHHTLSQNIIDFYRYKQNIKLAFDTEFTPVSSGNVPSSGVYETERDETEYVDTDSIFLTEEETKVIYEFIGRTWRKYLLDYTISFLNDDEIKEILNRKYGLGINTERKTDTGTEGK